ncbi:MAG: AAA family ATPase [Actinomycetota bacterium]|nr:AAA family ATPase [Actinomycetota bacterium]
MRRDDRLPEAEYRRLKAASNGHAEPEAPTNPLLAGRVLLGKAMVEGIDPPEELEPGLLLKGKVHHIFAAAGLGKTMLALWLVKRRIEAGERVVYFDDENGPRTVGERLQDMGVDPAKVDENLYYLPFPNLPMTAEARHSYRELLEEVEPSLIVFDSWISFLASAGMSENENTDVQTWCSAYTQTARALGIAVVLLDHVPHEGSRARGASRKRDEADVQWQLFKTKPFDRNSVGEINLHLEKDREAWLETSVKFSVGGTEDGKLVFDRSAGTIEEPDPTDGLTPSARNLLDVLRARFAGTGATASEWARAANVHRPLIYRAKDPLIGRGLIREDRKRYYPTPGPDEGGSATPKTGVQWQGVTPETDAHGQGVTPTQEDSVTPESGLFEPTSGEVLHGVTGCNIGESYTPADSVTTCNNPLKGVTGVTPPTSSSVTTLSVQEIAEEIGRPNRGPAKALASWLEDPNPTRLEYLTRSVLTARGLDPGAWERHAGAVKLAAADPDNHPLGCSCGGCL